MNQPNAETMTLNRQMGPIEMLFAGLSIIGSGWLFAALYTAQLAGPAGIISWVIGGAITLVIALIYAELGGMLPVGGALARIPHFAFGTTGGYMAGWLCWAAFVAIGPLEVIAVLDYASNYLPWLTMNEAGERVLTPAGVVVAVSMLAVFTVLNMFGVKIFARANTIITFWKIIIPLAASIILIAVGFRWENLTEFGGFAPYGGAGILSAVSSGGIMFAFYGFRMVTDMSGEARNPQRDVPMAVIGTVLFCIVLYILLQVAFIGAVSPSHLENGWKGITETAPGGPFAAFAALLGLTWLATLLYADAIVSPGGTGLSVIASTARLNYAMGRSGQIPALFARLNRYQVPAWSLAFNFVVGLLVVLPLPGWNQIVQFISTAGVLSFGFGPIALLVFRLEDPARPRPFRIPVATPFATVGFILVGFVVYWAGWETNWKILLVALAGLAIMVATRLAKPGSGGPLYLRASAWMWPYFIGTGLISYLGNYGNGLGVIPAGIDMLVVAVFSLAVLWLALRLRLDGGAIDTLTKPVRAELASVSEKA
jgi:amino acid transporter